MTLPVKEQGYLSESASVYEQMDDSHPLYPERSKVGEYLGELIIPKLDATLTEITCYPFRFIGLVPQRYVLVADLVKN